MSEPQTPLPAKLLVSFIFGNDEKEGEKDFYAKACDLLVREFGPLDYQSRKLHFQHTSYYASEMGDSLQRCFVSFRELVERDRLADIKLFTNRIEKKFLSHRGGRRVNIDPGLLSLENLVLATGKNFTHRIYLRHGIFAEVTMIFQKGKFVTLPWTYPDYASEEIIAVLAHIRTLLGADLRNR
jgi:hypothetical protein